MNLRWNLNRIVHPRTRNSIIIQEELVSWWYYKLLPFHTSSFVISLLLTDLFSVMLACCTLLLNCIPKNRLGVLKVYGWCLSSPALAVSLGFIWLNVFYYVVVIIVAVNINHGTFDGFHSATNWAIISMTWSNHHLLMWVQSIINEPVIIFGPIIQHSRRICSSHKRSDVSYLSYLSRLRLLKIVLIWRVSYQVHLLGM